MRWRKRLGALFLAVVLLLADSGNINFAMASEAENLNAEILQESTEEIDTETEAEFPEEFGTEMVMESTEDSDVGFDTEVATETFVDTETEAVSDMTRETGLSVEDTMEVSGENSFGTLLADVLTEETVEMEENNGYNVFSIEMNGTTATVNFETLETATLVVGIYDEAGNIMLAAGKCEVTPEDIVVNVNIETDTMPRYFYLRGFLIDPTCMRPLCTAYTSPNYTKEMQEFFAKTTDDFAADKVLNLDADKKNNFAVYRDDTILIPHVEGKNTVVSADEQSSTYVIENIDSSISGLKPGDIFAYDYDAENTLIVKVGAISVEGTTAIITGAETSLDEVFDYVKIDTEAYTQDMTVDDSTCADGVTCEGLETLDDGVQTQALEGENSLELGRKFDFVDKELSNHVTLSGSLTLKVTVSVKVYISWSRQYIELKIDYDAKIGFKISGKNGLESLRLAYFACSPLPGVYISFTPAFLLEVSAKLELNGKLCGTVGFSASIQDGVKDLTTRPELKAEIKGEMTVFLGLSLKPNIKIISKKVADAELEATIGAEMKGKLVYSVETSAVKDDDKYHECNVCVDGKITGKAELKFKVKFLDSKKLTLGDKFEFSILSTDFYYSFDKEEFGFKSCPYYRYRTTFKVLDENKNVLPNAVVVLSDVATVIKSDGMKETVTELKTDAQGRAVCFLPSGEYKVTVRAEGYQTKKITVRVDKDSVSTECRLKAIGGGNGDNGEKGFGQTLIVGEGYSGAVTEDGSLYMWGSNGHGQIGNGNQFDQYVPIKILDDVRTILSQSGGYYYNTGAITKDGSLYMWGANGLGQIGNGNTEQQITPIKVLSNVETLSMGRSFTGAITKNGSLYMWGDNEHGQIGNGSKENQYTPIKVLEDVETLSMGNSTIGAITKDGSLYMWGSNMYGQIGNQSGEDQYIPIKILEDVDMVSIEWSSYSVSVGAITKDGSLYMWGSNEYGQIGNGSRENQCTPVKVLENVKTVSIKNFTAAAVTENGNLYMWGNNGYGQIGSGNEENQYTPLKIFENVETVSMGSNGCTIGAITKDGSLYMWGYGTLGQIGNGTKNNHQFTPIKILSNVKKVAIGDNTTEAITKDGGLYMWGEGKAVGNGDEQLTPVKVLENVDVVLTSYFTAGAITIDGSLYMWGQNGCGQVGSGKREDQLTPYKVLDHVALPNSSFPATASAEPMILSADGVLSVADTQPDAGIALQSDGITGLRPNEVHNYYVMKDCYAEDALSPSNLLYLTQAVTDVAGNLNITCPNMGDAGAEAFAVPMTQTDLSSALVKTDDLCYTGKQQYASVTVTLNGETLTEGKDYELTGDYCATDSGIYHVTVRGIGLYQGSVTASYRIEPIVFGDANSDGKVDSKDAVMMRRYMAGYFDLDINLTACDVNVDGRVDSKDVVKILRKLAGYDVTLGEK